MGFIDYIPIIGAAYQGIQHEKHQLKYHPDKDRKSGFHLSNLSSIGQGFSAFAEGFTGGEKMQHDDRVDKAWQDRHGHSGQQRAGSTAYHFADEWVYYIFHSQRLF